MNTRRSYLVLVSLIVLALVGVGLIALPQSPFYKKPVLGLDLQGGLQVVLKADPPPGRPLTENDLKRSETIIRNRIDKLGVSEPIVARQGENQISVMLAGVTDVNRARELIGKTAQLEFYDLQGDLVPPSISRGTPIPTEQLYNLLVGQQSSIQEGGGKEWRVFDVKTKKVIAGIFPTKAAAENSKKFKEGGEDVRALGVPKNRIVITCSAASAVVCPPGSGAPVPGVTYYYLFKYQPLNAEKPIPEMKGIDLKLSGTRSDFDTTTGEPIVLMQFTKDGTKKFGEITRELALRGKRVSFGGQDQFQNFAIVLDNEIRSWPSIDFNENPNGITGSNGAQITGMAGVNEAKDLAIVLQTGALPVKFVTLEETQISATLGEDSLRQAWQAAIAGLILVALFLLVFYRFLGLIAVLGLGIYAALLYGAVLLFDVTLTLPGFAGMILTIGVAADANIVVFERIKEESREGKSVRAAIASGYGKGLSTIIDANVVTAITALVLFSLATAGVKGFALMLLIGTAMSVVTAVFATRAMLGLLAGFRWFDSPAFMGATGAKIPSWIRHDYVGKRKIWFAVSGAIMAISIGSLLLQNLNLGIDFRGGTELTIQTAQPVALEEVRAQAAQIGQEGATIQGVGSEIGNQQYREFQMRTQALTPAEQQSLTTSIKNEFDAETSSTTVSASFGSQIARSAMWAVVFSLLLVVGYIWIRFQWKFAVATIVALLHDVLIAIGIYSLFGLEVSTATVAAILTVLGYSIYDSIIILDRVRENIPLMRRASFREIGNVSLWETIRRSLATTFITLLPIGALYFFGGDTLKDFAFALLVGIGSGAYSSIFLAVPLLSWLKEREPEYAKRMAADVPEDDLVVAQEAMHAAAEEPVPEIPLLAPTDHADRDGDAAKRERRRQRRKTRPHGRAR
ncbi:MAG: protein translocase subunit SecD [Actinobacteria bacterium]|nr:protein translocase subunit SecD [Actinomycetota bacterium]